MGNFMTTLTHPDRSVTTLGRRYALFIKKSHETSFILLNTTGLFIILTRQKAAEAGNANVIARATLSPAKEHICFWL